MTNESLPVCNALWLGGDLSPIAAACLASFVRHGHRVVLHCYDDVKRVPEGVALADAAETVPASRIIRHAKSGSYALFSDLFRYALLARGQGIWIDCDMYCVRPVPAGNGYMYGWESEHSINNAIFQLPPDSPLLTSLIGLFDVKSPIWPWLAPKAQAELQARRAAGESFTVAELPWGSAGPAAVTYLLTQAGLAGHSTARSVFYPLRWEHAPALVSANFDVASIISPDTLTVHLWTSALTKHLDRVEPGSAAHRLLSEGTLFDETRLTATEPGGSGQGRKMAGNAILVAASGWRQEAWAMPIRAAEPSRPVVMWPDVGDPKAIAHALVWNPPAGVFRGLDNLRTIFSLGAGVDALVLRDDLPDVPIVRIVDPDLTQRMTEWVTHQVLMHHRRQRWYDGEQAARRWRIPPQPSARQVRVGIMGMGVFGRDAAAVLVRLGFDVAGWSRSRHDIPGVRSFAGPTELDAFLERTDILVVLLPLTSETRGILAMPLFRKLARNGALGPPVLINAGRGGLQIEADIAGALDGGILGGASLDVFEREPLDPQSSLWRRANVVITPHVAGASAPGALIPGILRQIASFERGEPLQNVVDRSRGY